jgi:hypothetical protein
MTNSPEPGNNTPYKRNKPQYQSAHGPKQIKRTPSRASIKAVQAKNSPPPPKVNTKKRNIITFGAIGVLVVLVAVFVYYMIAIAPLQRVLLTVGTENISTSYFLKRMVANPNGDITSTLQGLEGEYIIKQQAPGQGVAPVTDAAIDEYLRTQAKTTYPNLTDDEFNKWFNEQLSNTGLSAKEYREVSSHEILRNRLTDTITTDLPATFEQYHLWAAAYSTQAAAAAAKAKVDAGTSFETVATAAATAIGQTSNGDQGWWPLEALDAQLIDPIKALEIGKVSDPVTLTQYSSSSSTGTTSSYLLLQVTEKDPAKAATDSQITAIKNKAILAWLNDQFTKYTITLHNQGGSTVDAHTGTLDTQTTTWLNYEAQKLVAKRPTVTETTTPITTGTGTTTTPATTTTAVTTTTSAAPASTTTTAAAP